MLKHRPLTRASRGTLLIAALLALCTGCSSSPDNQCSSPRQSINATFDPFSMVFAGEHPTDVTICDTYRCETDDFDPDVQAPGTNRRLAIPLDRSTLVITDLTIRIYSNGKLLREARAAGPLVAWKPGQVAIDSCGDAGITVKYNAQTKELESGPRSF